MSSGSTYQRQHHHPRQGHPPRVPPRRGRSVQHVRVRRSRDRIQSLGFFQENLEIEQDQGSAPDRVVLEVDVEEQATGELQLSAGFSSLERFLVNLSIQQRNFMGRGPDGAGLGQLFELFASRSSSASPNPICSTATSPSASTSIAAIYNSFNFFGNERNTTYEQITTGGQIRLGVPLTENLSLAAALRPGL